MEKLQRASYKEKETKSLPKGAQVLSKETSVSVEEIENGFLIVKNKEIKYAVGKSRGPDWLYVTEKYFSKTNPLTIDLEKVPLADKID